MRASPEKNIRANRSVTDASGMCYIASRSATVPTGTCLELQRHSWLQVRATRTASFRAGLCALFASRTLLVAGSAGIVDWPNPVRGFTNEDDSGILSKQDTVDLDFRHYYRVATLDLLLIHHGFRSCKVNTGQDPEQIETTTTAFKAFQRDRGLQLGSSWLNSSFWETLIVLVRPGEESTAVLALKWLLDATSEAARPPLWDAVQVEKHRCLARFDGALEEKLRASAAQVGVNTSAFAAMLNTTGVDAHLWNRLLMQTEIRRADGCENRSFVARMFGTAWVFTWFAFVAAFALLHNDAWSKSTLHLTSPLHNRCYKAARNAFGEHHSVTKSLKATPEIPRFVRRSIQMLAMAVSQTLALVGTWSFPIDLVSQFATGALLTCGGLGAVRLAAVHVPKVVGFERWKVLEITVFLLVNAGLYFLILLVPYARGIWFILLLVIMVIFWGIFTGLITEQDSAGKFTRGSLLWLTCMFAVVGPTWVSLSVGMIPEMWVSVLIPPILVFISVLIEQVLGTLVVQNCEYTAETQWLLVVLFRICLELVRLNTVLAVLLLSLISDSGFIWPLLYLLQTLVYETVSKLPLRHCCEKDEESDGDPNFAVAAALPFTAGEIVIRTGMDPWTYRSQAAAPPVEAVVLMMHIAQLTFIGFPVGVEADVWLLGFAFVILFAFLREAVGYIVAKHAASVVPRIPWERIPGHIAAMMVGCAMVMTSFAQVSSLWLTYSHHWAACYVGGGAPDSAVETSNDAFIGGALVMSTFGFIALSVNLYSFLSWLCWSVDVRQSIFGLSGGIDGMLMQEPWSSSAKIHLVMVDNTDTLQDDAETASNATINPADLDPVSKYIADPSSPASTKSKNELEQSLKRSSLEQSLKSSNSWASARGKLGSGVISGGDSRGSREMRSLIQSLMLEESIQTSSKLMRSLSKIPDTALGATQPQADLACTKNWAAALDVLQEDDPSISNYGDDSKHLDALLANIAPHNAPAADLTPSPPPKTPDPNALTGERPSEVLNMLLSELPQDTGAETKDASPGKRVAALEVTTEKWKAAPAALVTTSTPRSRTAAQVASDLEEERQGWGEDTADLLKTADSQQPRQKDMSMSNFMNRTFELDDDAVDKLIEGDSDAEQGSLMAAANASPGPKVPATSVDIGEPSPIKLVDGAAAAGDLQTGPEHVDAVVSGQVTPEDAAHAQQGEEEVAQKQADELARLQKEECARQEAERAREEAERAREAEERAKVEAENQARKEAEEKARQEEIDHKRRQEEAENRARKEAEEKARQEEVARKRRQEEAIQALKEKRLAAEQSLQEAVKARVVNDIKFAIDRANEADVEQRVVNAAMAQLQALLEEIELADNKEKLLMRRIERAMQAKVDAEKAETSQEIEILLSDIGPIGQLREATADARKTRMVKKKSIMKAEAVLPEVTADLKHLLANKRLEEKKIAGDLLNAQMERASKSKPVIVTVLDKLRQAIVEAAVFKADLGPAESLLASLSAENARLTREAQEVLDRALTAKSPDGVKEGIALCDALLLQQRIVQAIAEVRAIVGELIAAARADENEARVAKTAVIGIFVDILRACGDQELRQFHNDLQDLKGALRVFCRVRPPNSKETRINDPIVAEIVDAFTVSMEKADGEKTPFGYDAIFGPTSTQNEVFAECRGLVQSVFDGYNVTIFTYGQTGAGKTWTLYGTGGEPGISPRTCEEVFNVVERDREKSDVTINASMVELYNSELRDLLNTSKTPPKLEFRSYRTQDGTLAQRLEGQLVTPVARADDLGQVVAMGLTHRKVKATNMNAASSRSHLMLIIGVEIVDKATGNTRSGKITIVDLAGSERLAKSGVTGEGQKEAIEINKSLTALGDVMMAFSSGAKVIPYRNHKLTQMMQDSLGGSAKTLMFVNISPAASNVDETINALKYASRARCIENVVKKHK